MKTIDISHSQEVYTVSRLNREARFLLENTFAGLWVEGEVSNFVAPQSGHWYFSLKDPLAQVKCAMFRPQNRKLGFTLKDGMHVIMRVRVSLYEGRGDFQLLVEELEEAGEGKLRQEFEALKKRLSELGLFDSHRKKSIPSIPQCIGVVTSPTGAAIRDILTVLKRRFPCVPVIIYPTLVQGDLAAANIVSAIEIANQRKECDVLIIARGGGSLEDLWPFNEERVAHAIYASTIPTISGVGHEIDFTIADFVADLRAPTPSAAAELATPDRDELLATILQQEKLITRLIKQTIEKAKEQLGWITKQLQQQHPKRRLQEQTQQLDLYELTLTREFNKLLLGHQTKLQTLNAKLTGLTPLHTIRTHEQQLILKKQTLHSLVTVFLRHQQELFSNAAAKLDGLSPLSTLKRGFSIATSKKTGKILRTATETSIGDKIKLTLLEGSVDCEVISKVEG